MAAAGACALDADRDWGFVFFVEARVMSASRGWAVGGLDWRAPIFF